MRARHTQSRGHLVWLFVTIVVCTASTRSFFRCADDAVFDACQTNCSRILQHSTLLVYCEPNVFLDTARLVSLLKLIEQHQPEQIAIAHQMTAEQFTAIEQLSFAEKIVVGCDINGCQPQGLRYGHLGLNGDKQTRLRWHIPLDSQHGIPSFASKLGMEKTFELVPDDRIYVRFKGGRDSLPHVDLTAIEQQRVVDALVKDRVVVIGPKSSSDNLVGTAANGFSRMSRLEAHGNIVETMIGKESIRELGPLYRLLVLLLLAAASLLIFRRCNIDRLLRFGICLFLFVLLASVAVDHYASTRTPLIACFLTVGGVWLLVWQQRCVYMSQAFEQWTLTSKTGLQTSRNHSYQDLWKTVGESASNIFQMHRVVMLELPNGESHFQIAATIGCQEQDIAEQRRDHLRQPYRDAIEQHCAVMTCDRGFFASSDKDQNNELMVPMMIGNEVIGMIVCQLPNQHSSNDPQFDHKLIAFADEMAEYISLQRQEEMRRLNEQNSLYRLKHTPEQLLANATSRLESELNQYANILEGAVDTLEPALAIYNGFGQYVKANQSMIERLQRNDIPVLDSNIATVIQRLSGLPPSECQEIFRQCIVERRSTLHEVIACADSDLPGLMFVKSLNTDESDNGELASRFLTLQIQDGEVFRDVISWQHQMSNSRIDRLEAQLQQTVNEYESIDGFREANLLSEIKELVSLANASSEAGSHLDEKQVVELSIDRPFKTAAQEVAGLLAAKSIELKTAFSEQTVVANPFLLKRTFSIILDRLVNETPRKSTINVSCVRQKELVAIHFCTQDESSERAAGGAAEYLIQESEDSLHEIRQWAESWNGDFEVRCGSNYSIEMILRLPAAAFISKSEDV